jgi:amino acid adenylation domain-containing protein
MGNTGSDLLIFDRRLMEEREYWLHRLSRDAAQPAHLLCDYPRSSTHAAEADSVELHIEGEAYRSLSRLTRNGPFLLYTTLLAALKICLHKYTGGSRVAVGSPARRSEPEAPPVLNALAIVDDVDDRTSFRELLHGVRQTLLEAYERQRYPIDRVLKDLALDGGENRCPLFDVALSLQEIHHPMPRLNQDLTMVFARQDAGLRGEITYRADLFARESIVRFGRHFVNVLKASLARVDARIGDLEIVDPDERRRLLSEWNQTRRDYREGAPIHRLFEAEAERRADAVAVVYRSEHLSFGELRRRSHRLARSLRGLAVRPEALVATYLDRSPELVIGFLGILEAGGVYVPLEPSYPKERIEFLLRDTGARVVLTRERLRKDLPEDDAEGAEVPVVLCVDADRGEASSAGEEAPLEGSAFPANLAYVIYTSGSTGLPKGAMVEHRGMLNHLHAKIDDLQLKETDVVAQTAPLSFDISVWQFLAILLAGGKVHVVSEETVHDPGGLLELVQREDVTILETVPSMLRAMLPVLSEAGAEGVGSSELRWLMVTGEALPPELCRHWLDLLPSIPLMNAYGPTECSDDVTHYRIQEPPASDVVRTPIGRPVGNMRMYVLDRESLPVPVQIPGELYAGGIGVGRGYLGSGRRTAAVFVPDPFSGEPGARLYKTGDLVRYRPDGNLEFLGRVDHQVKIRGFRIELGEIEAALLALEGIESAAVVAREDGSGGKSLVAYLVKDPDAALDPGELRFELKRRIPDHMAPSAFVFLPALPLTPSGKVDRKALPAPDRSRPEQERVYVAPRTATERMLAEIWSEVLEIDRVGVDDNFFDLGGHSLLATQVMSRARQKFRVELPLRELFAGPSVSHLAALVDAARREGSALAAPSIPRIDPRGEPRLSFAQERLWFLDQLMPGSPLYNVPAGLRLRGRLDLPALKRTFQELVRRHEVLRTSFTAREGRPVQVIAEALRLSLPVMDLSELRRSEAEGELDRSISAEAQRAFDLARGPLLRVCLFRLEEEEFAALLIMHHIVSDGWSMGVLVRELAALYAAYSAGKPSPLEDPPLQYADFAHWQRQLLSGEILEEQIGYWKEQLAHLPVLLLPADRPRPEIPSFRGASEAFRLPPALSGEVRALSRRASVTPFMTLMAAFQTLLGYYSGQDDVVVGTDVANRNRAETEGLIGFFVNQLVLRTDLSGKPTFREVLERVQRMTVEAYAHQDLPFDRLVEAINPERAINRSPLFQVKMVLQNATLPALETLGLSWTSLEIRNRTAKFDLLFNLWDTEEGLRGVMEYSTDLFDSARIVRMLEDFEVLLGHVAADPDIRLDALTEGLARRARSRDEAQEWVRKEANLRKLRGRIRRNLGEIRKEGPAERRADAPG